MEKQGGEMLNAPETKPDAKPPPGRITATADYQTLIGRRDVVRIFLLLLGVSVSCFLLSKSTNPFQSLPQLFSFSAFNPSSTAVPLMDSSTSENWEELGKILGNASTEDKTVIITTLNEAWAEPNSIFDLFLESFRVGQGTERLRRHMVVACLDDKAYARCLEIHSHCYVLKTNGTDFSGEKRFMTPDYLKMMWRRVDFLASVLRMGYSFIFTDADIMWLRNPFPRLHRNADFQIACDNFNGNPKDINNRVNGGFTYVRSNNLTINFYKYWYYSRLKFPGSHDQDVFDKIKHDSFVRKLRLRMRFLDTVYFGGFCEPSKDWNLVCTMHANCCIGVENKVKDLGQVLEDWKKYLSATKREIRKMGWSDPENCRRSMGH